MYKIDGNSIYVYNQAGLYLNEFPYPEANSWEDPTISFNNPKALSFNEQGDMIVMNQDDSKVKLAVGRGIIEICPIIADIYSPQENALVCGKIPITGSAGGVGGFKNYLLEYASENAPNTWETIITSSSESIVSPSICESRIPGNLANWDVTNLDMGIYTLRLRVYDNEGKVKEDAIKVHVAEEIDGQGAISSKDGVMTLTIPEGAVSDNYDLFSITTITPDDMPSMSSEGMIGKIYRLLPSGYQFLRPCTLTYDYSGDPNDVGMYQWNPLSQCWYSLDSEYLSEEGPFSLSLSHLDDYGAYYCLVSQVLTKPVLFPPMSPTPLQKITVNGKASPGVSVEIYVNDQFREEVRANQQSGNFTLQGIFLNEGDNSIFAKVIDYTGNEGPSSDPVIVRVEFNWPSEVYTIGFKNEDFTEDFSGEISPGDTLYIELKGSDGDPLSINAAEIIIKSSITDSTGFAIILLETGENTGIYRGTVKVGETSEPESGIIGAAAQNEKIIISLPDNSIFSEITVTDSLRPPAPTITSSTHPSLFQDTFEVDLDYRDNEDNFYGAVIERTTEKTSTGQYSLKITNKEEGGDFTAFLKAGDFDAREYPLISFDYLLQNPNISVNLIASVNNSWKEIVFTGKSNNVDNFQEYRSIGRIEGVVADNNWHRASFNLYPMLRNDDPDQAEYIVEEFFFADYIVSQSLEIEMGNQNSKGATYYLDNFIINRADYEGQADNRKNNRPYFSWSVNDQTVNTFCYKLDNSPGTDPDIIDDAKKPESPTEFEEIEDGIWYFHLKAKDAAGNWGPPNHYQLIVDTIGPVAGSPQPSDGTASGNLEIKLTLLDANGSGVNPDTIELKVNDTIYDFSSKAFTYDQYSGRLIFSLDKVSIIPNQGDTIQVNLLEAKDYAGNSLQSSLSWSWTANYTEIPGGYLALLTTDGGYTPTWSHDGTKIAFMSKRSLWQDIWVIEANDYLEQSKTACRLTDNEANNHHPAWSPTDNRLAFVSDREGGEHGYEHIYVIDSNCPGVSNPLQITSGETYDSHPTWSPDGIWIAFAGNGELWKIKADGSEPNPQQITFDSIAQCLDPVWSPDPNNSIIAFTKSFSTQMITLLDLESKEQKVLTFGGYDFCPTWAQENKILYVSNRNQSSPTLYAINSDGREESEFIVNGAHYDDYAPWDSEPDLSKNNQLAFQSTRNAMCNIWVVIPDIDNTPSPTFFSPSYEGNEAENKVSFPFIKGMGNITLKIIDNNDAPVAQLLDREVIKESVTWNGRYYSDGNNVPDGDYTYALHADYAGNISIKEEGTITVDTTPPSVITWDLFKNELVVGEQPVTITVMDESPIDKTYTKLEYGISASENDEPDNWSICYIDSNYINDNGGWLISGIVPVPNPDWEIYDKQYLYLRVSLKDICGNIKNDENGEYYKEKRYIIGKNEAPIARAKVFLQDPNSNDKISFDPNQWIRSVDTILLYGEDSSVFDPNHCSLSYEWKQIEGKTVVLHNANTPLASFSVNDVKGETLEFQLTVEDSCGCINTECKNPILITIHLKKVNTLPTVDAGPNWYRKEGLHVVLDGSDTIDIDTESDPNNRIVSYLWTWSNCESMIIPSTDIHSPVFEFDVIDELPEDCSMAFTLTATDSLGEKGEDTCNVTLQAEDDPPEAEACIKLDLQDSNCTKFLEFQEGDVSTVYLDASCSSDPDPYSALSYQWKQDPNDGINNVILKDTNNIAVVTFNPPPVGVTNEDFHFWLTVTDANDNKDWSDEDKIKDDVLVRVTFFYEPPVADAGPDQTVQESDPTIYLNGLNSSFDDRIDCYYHWSQIDGPEVQLNDANIADPSFTNPADRSGDPHLVFKLKVRDSSGIELTPEEKEKTEDSVKIYINFDLSECPVAVISTDPDSERKEREQVDLIASTSNDPDTDQGDKISYLWEQKEGPTVDLTNADSSSAYFIAPELDANSDSLALVFKITVKDLLGCEDTGEVTITITENPRMPKADAGEDQYVQESRTVYLNGEKTSDPDDDLDEGSYEWKQLKGINVTLSDSSSVQPTFVAPAVEKEEILLFRLTVKDKTGSKNSDEVKIIVEDNGIPPIPELPRIRTFLTYNDKEVGIDPGRGNDLVKLDIWGPGKVSEKNNRPKDLIYGLFNFEAKIASNGGTAHVTIYLPEPAPPGYTWFKYSETDGWFDYSDYASFNLERNEVTLTLVDGDRKRGDDDGIANRIIKDPSGLGLSSSIEDPNFSTHDSSSGFDSDSSCFIFSCQSFLDRITGLTW